MRRICHTPRAPAALNEAQLDSRGEWEEAAKEVTYYREIFIEKKKRRAERKANEENIK